MFSDYQPLLADPRHGGDEGQDVGGGGGGDTAHVSLVNNAMIALTKLNTDYQSLLENKYPY